MAEPVTHLPQPQPQTVTLLKDDMATVKFTPRELRVIKEQTGRSLGEVMADETSDDKFVVLAWMKLRRTGSPLDWDEMDDVLIELKPGDEQPVDPTNAEPSTSSPASAATGA